MANSLKSKLAKLRHDRNISEKKYEDLLNKLDGHDRELRNKVIDKFAEALKEICKNHSVGKDEYTNEPLYAHEDRTWHNLIDDVAEQMKEK